MFFVFSSRRAAVSPELKSLKKWRNTKYLGGKKVCASLRTKVRHSLSLLLLSAAAAAAAGTVGMTFVVTNRMECLFQRCHKEAALHTICRSVLPVSCLVRARCDYHGLSYSFLIIQELLGKSLNMEASMWDVLNGLLIIFSYICVGFSCIFVWMCCCAAHWEKKMGQIINWSLYPSQGPILIYLWQTAPNNKRINTESNPNMAILSEGSR